jgi:hypothetical protein
MEVWWKDWWWWAEAIFYRIDSTADWQFFTFAQEPIPCERYNTEELQKAFFHQICNYNFETKERNTVGNYLNLKK